MRSRCFLLRWVLFPGFLGSVLGSGDISVRMVRPLCPQLVWREAGRAVSADSLRPPGLLLGGVRGCSRPSVRGCVV